MSSWAGASSLAGAEPEKMSMKVLWVGHFVPWPLRGGVFLRSYHLLRQAALGNEVAFAGLVQDELLSEPDLLEEARIEIGKLCQSIALVPIEFRGKFRRQHVLCRSLFRGAYDEIWLRSMTLASRLREVRDTFVPEVVHFDTVGLAQYAEIVSNATKVLNHHNVESHMMARRANLEPGPLRRAVMRLQARRLETLERRTAPRMELNLTVSDLDSDRLSHIAPDADIVEVPNGVDLDYFRFERDPSRSPAASMIFVGGMDWYPNERAVNWFLDNAWSRLAEEVPEATFTVVGKAPTPRLVAAAERSPNVRALGSVADIRPHVRDSAVFVCPFHDGGGTRLKVLDAMAQGIPIVATTMAVEGIPIRSGVHALIADTAEDFVSAVLRLWREPALGDALALEARRMVENTFGWDAIGQRLRRAYAHAREAREKPTRGASTCGTTA